MQDTKQVERRSELTDATLKIAPSILSANWVRLGEDVAAAERGGAGLLHVDVMDGHFVPNITVGIPMVKWLKTCTNVPLDTHLMIEEPARYVADFIKAGSSMVSIHIEADPHVLRTLAYIKELGARAGIAINPGTPLTHLEEALEVVDFVLLMSVNPGFGGQTFIPRSLERVRRLRSMIDERGLNTLIEIDGGVDTRNAAEVVRAGVNIIVAGSAVFGEKLNPEETVRAMLDAGTQWV